MNAGIVIKAALGSLVGDRVHASTFPETRLQDWPAIRFTVVSDTPFPDQCGSDDEASDDVRVQIDVVAMTYDEMKALKSAVIAAMADTDPGCERAGGFETYDADTKTHRAHIDYVFHPSEQRRLAVARKRSTRTGRLGRLSRFRNRPLRGFSSERSPPWPGASESSSRTPASSSSRAGRPIRPSDTVIGVTNADPPS
jgi:hypothetical protein